MDTTALTLVLFFIFIVATLIVTLKYHNRTQGGTGFIIGSRQVGLWGIFSSIIGYLYSGPAFFWWFGFVAALGFGSIWVQLAISLTFVFMALAAPRAQQLSKQHNYITLPDLIQDRHGPLMAWLIKIGAAYGAIVLTVGQLYVAGHVVSGLLGVSTAWGTLLAATVVCSYVARSGLDSVIGTDILQQGVIGLIAVVAIFFIDWPDTEIIVNDILTPDPAMIIQFSILGMTIAASPDMWQRFFAARSGSVARNGTLTAVAAHVILLMFGITLFITSTLATTTSTNPNDAFLAIFFDSTLPPLAIALAGVLVVAAILSTLDNQVFSFSSILVKNVLNIDADKEQRKFIRISRMATFAMIYVLAAASLLVDNLMDFLFTLHPVLGVLALPIFYAVFCRQKHAHTDRTIATGVIISTLVYCLLHYTGYLANLYLYIVPYFLPALFIAADHIRGLAHNPGARSVG